MLQSAISSVVRNGAVSRGMLTQAVHEEREGHRGFTQLFEAQSSWSQSLNETGGADSQGASGRGSRGRTGGKHPRPQATGRLKLLRLEYLVSCGLNKTHKE